MGTLATIYGIIFDSEKEADFYSQLKIMTEAGEIAGFCRQARFVVCAGDENTRAAEYVTDFVVFNNDGTYKIVDTKGIETDVFKLKKKMMREKYPHLEISIE